MQDSAAPKLPRQVESDPLNEAVEKALARDRKPLWAKGTLNVTHIEFTPAFEKALMAAANSKQLERGLDHIEKILRNEEQGIAAVREKQGTPAAQRISRLLLIADEGSERFYRSCEAVLFRHSNRVLGLRVAVSNDRFSQNLFGADQLLKALLVSDRDSVARVLLSLAN